MRYVSLFSGVEAASVAWEPLGWEAMAFSEIEPFPCQVLKERFPNVPNLGDVTKVDWNEFAATAGTPDLVVGGSPCQSFSIAGGRDSLDGESRLMFEFVRAVDELRPRWLLWENVPGALSAKGLEGEKGGAFQCLLRELAKLGYGLAWRVLDAQYFGVAQRRRRVFLVGCLGDAERAGEVLFEPESVSGNPAPSREPRQGAPEPAQGDSRGGSFSVVDDPTPKVDSDVSATLRREGQNTHFAAHAVNSDSKLGIDREIAASIRADATPSAVGIGAVDHGGA